MQPGFEQSYSLFTPQQPEPWRPFTENKPYIPSSAEALMAEELSYPTNKTVDDSSLRCLFPGSQQRPGLSLSLFNSKPSENPLRLGFQGGNFNGFFSLRNSKYLEPVQELLREVCSFGDLKNGGDQRRKLPLPLREDGASSSSSSADVAEQKRRFSQLVSMVEELDRRYRKYCEQMRTVVVGFEMAAGEGAAKIYSAMAMKAMSRHFRCLRDAIVGQMKEMKKATGERDAVAAGVSRGETPRLRLVDRHLRRQKMFQQSGAMEHHPWRPQRGLPERAVSVLRAWLFEHFLHPYPSDVDKHILSRQTGLSRSQVCNWFINARVRLWKPMVEEMYLEETKDKQDDPPPRQNPNSLQTQNPNSLAIQHLHLQDDQPSRPPPLPSDEDSLSSVVHSSHHPLQQYPRPDHNFGLLDVDFSSYGECADQQAFSNGVSLTLGLQQHTGGGVSLCFSPGSQSSLFFSKETQMVGCQPVQFSILEGDTQNAPYRNLMGETQVLQDFQG